MCRCLCCSSFVLHVIYFLLSSKSNLASSIKLSPNSIMMGLFTCMYFGLARESLRVWFHDLSLYPSILAYHKLSISSLTNESLDVGGESLTQNLGTETCLCRSVWSLENKKSKHHEQGVLHFYHYKTRIEASRDVERVLQDNMCTVLTTEQSNQ